MLCLSKLNREHSGAVFAGLSTLTKCPAKGASAAFSFAGAAWVHGCTTIEQDYHLLIVKDSPTLQRLSCQRHCGYYCLLVRCPLPCGPELLASC